MDLKALVKTGLQKKPPRVVLHGVHGVGKSTWAANAPAPIFLQTEDGLTNIDVPHFPVAEILNEVWKYMAMVITEDHNYKTFVVDTADWLQKLIWDEVCREHAVDNIETPGYGKGYQFAMKHWDRFFLGLEKIREKGLAIVILAHNEVKTHNPPDGEPYDRYQIKIHRHAATKLEEWADVVLFADFKVYVGEGKATGAGERVIHTTNRPAWRAKTRYNLPDELPLNFNVLLTCIKGDKKNGKS